MSTQIEPLLTVADLDCMPDDGNCYELIEGEIFVSCAPSLTHQLIVKNIIVLFQIYLNKYPIGMIVPGPGVIFSNLSGVIPDVVFVSRERRGEIASGERITGAPDIVIEIASPGTENEHRDRTVKRQLYGKFGVKEYWIIYPEKREVEAYHLNEQTLMLVATLKNDDDITSPMLPGFTAQVSDIFRI
ncbi:MAG: Uma2 family endonuclease [Acidobacteriota bacterium]|nr:Uma2 family endonuclease [Acidobacteriota bacterium]